MATPAPYPYPPPQPPVYYAPRPKGSLAITVVKVVVGGAVATVAYYVGAKVLQSQNINAGCPSGQVGLPFVCAPASGGGPPSNCGACTPSCNGTCPSGQACINGSCQTQNAPQIPGSLAGPGNLPIYSQMCQPVTASLSSGCGVAVCGSPIVCAGSTSFRVTLLDNSAKKLPIANATLLIQNPNPNIIQTDAQSYQTDANGNIIIIVTHINPPTFACNWTVTQDAVLQVVVQALLPGAGGPSLTVYVPAQTNYKTNEGFMGTCGGCSNCSG